MDSKIMVQQGAYGRLPASAPLANPYVPFQLEDPPKYEPRTAIIRGTLFRGLDLPFMNMVNKNELPMTPLAELQTMAFAMHELSLYLDTHRDDKEAFEVFQTFQLLILSGAHTRPCTGDLIGKNCIFYTFLDATLVPFISQLFTHLNRL